ncbi:hypothetical protein ACFX15_039018 [Malus domestica]
MHEVIVTNRTIDAIKLATEQSRLLWRVSSTLFAHIASDAVLKPLGHFAESPLASKYPPIYAGEFVEQELAMRFTSRKNMALPILMFVFVMAGLVDQGQGSTCASTFFSALVQLIPCRAAVVPFSPIPPSEICCGALKALGQPCLCVLVNGPPISGVDRSMAMQLPEKCGANFEPCTF